MRVLCCVVFALWFSSRCHRYCCCRVVELLEWSGRLWSPWTCSTSSTCRNEPTICECILLYSLNKSCHLIQQQRPRRRLIFAMLITYLLDLICSWQRSQWSRQWQRQRACWHDAAWCHSSSDRHRRPRRRSTRSRPYAAVHSRSCRLFVLSWLLWKWKMPISKSIRIISNSEKKHHATSVFTFVVQPPYLLQLLVIIYSCTNDSSKNRN